MKLLVVLLLAALCLGWPQTVASTADYDAECATSEACGVPPLRPHDDADVHKGPDDGAG